MSYYAIDAGPNSLAHHGILGMKWGIRRYQNEDGSLTSAGRVRYYGAGGDRKGYYREKGSAKRYKDALKYETRKAYRRASEPLTFLSKGYRKWRKESPDNRGLSNYAMADKERRILARFGNNKRALADAKYAYEHKNLSKYVNRDGSLTLAGKLKYWDTDKERGAARMQRDIARDKKRGTTSERDMAKYNASQRRSFKYNRNMAGINAIGSVGAAITGRPLTATRRAAAASNYALKGLAKYTKKAENTLPGQIWGMEKSGRIETKAVNTARKAAKYNYNTNMGTIKKVGSGAAKAARYNYNTNTGTIKKVGSGVAKAARYSYDTNMDTVKKITRKRKRS